MSIDAQPTQTDPRKQRARATRRRMVQAAYGLFCERGFNVPMTAIAAQADVAVQTLYFTFHTKVNLLAEALQFAVHGDDLPIPPHLRPWFAEMIAEPDPRRAVHIILKATQGIYDRVGPLAGVFKTGEAEITGMWRHSEDLRYEGMSSMVAALIKKRGLKRGVDQRSATDVTFVLLSPETYQTFVVQRGWTPKRWRDWTADALIHAIFAP